MTDRNTQTQPLTAYSPDASSPSAKISRHLMPCSHCSCLTFTQQPSKTCPLFCRRCCCCYCGQPPGHWPCFFLSSHTLTHLRSVKYYPANRNVLHCLHNDLPCVLSSLSLLLLLFIHSLSFLFIFCSVRTFPVHPFSPFSFLCISYQTTI